MGEGTEMTFDFAVTCVALGSFCLGCIVGAIGLSMLAGATLRDLREVFLGDDGT
jgi:hypothetical protein